MRYDAYYKLVEHPNMNDSDHWCIELTTGDFSGIIYQYGDVGFAKESNKDGTMTLKFNYDIIHVPDGIKEVVYTDEEGVEMHNLLGNILVEIIDDDLEAKREDRDGSTGDDNFKGTVTRRTFYPKGNPLLKE